MSVVRVERRGVVLVMTIDRPVQRNAVNRAVSLALADALDTLDADPALHVGIVTGAGGNFCSGMDLKAFVAGERPELDGRGFAGLTEAPPCLTADRGGRGLCAGGLVRLHERVPPAIALEYALTDERMDAATAQRWGLVNRLVPAGTALDTALALAAAIAANAPLAVLASKRIMAEAPGWPLADRWNRQRAMVEAVLASADAREGARAFAEKRAPVWRGA